MKPCTKCKQNRPAADILSNGWCRACNAAKCREWYARNKDVVSAKGRQRRLQKPETVAAEKKSWYDRNKDRIAQRKRELYAANIETVAVDRQIRYAKNKAIESERSRKWRLNNPERKSALEFLRRSRLTAGRCDLTDEQWQMIKATYKNRCAYCGEKKALTKDHVVPVSKGGEHTAANIVPACQSCNSRKNAKPPQVEYQPHLYV